MSAIRSFVEVIVSPFQAIEDTIRAIIFQRNVNVATGAQLTQLGKLVGQPRNGITDDEIYRRYVRAKVIANKSDGQPETMYRLARMVLGTTTHTLEIDNQGAAAFVLRVSGAPLADDVAAVLIHFLRKAASTGVRVILEYSPADPALVMRWGTGTWGQLWASGTD